MGTGHHLRVGVLVFDGAEELDVVGPYEVLSAWAGLSALHPEVVTFSADGAGVRCAKGLCLVPDTSADDVGPLHVLVYPGGRGTRALATDAAHLDWLRGVRATTPLVTSVCTGALVLAAAGLLAGRPATTYWAAFDELAAIDPSVLADTEARFVDDGDVVTSAGVSAGIDMALHLVARLESPEVARAVRRAIQYDPAPPV
ncbi:DJ-1/PfpI family protein [Cellulomonas fimi]|uniref:ThiJ/PfpI domain-containing protein n=1 Tax=Cellulomonas fimi (strain ATCC 484 / DSM 20113 / JCM 1341 / CCUG 24087 / LMG 16345 / NBRC 15513 / NCIMB 8980 / NCTC 7547 / NRS-133) TaxID=590998 RepID=F4H1M5_CELFA|nr:DJ-1/PfpI family protein [Cellulomonas fimi]AEE46324.1 ThiJ/PfpI domain-containing protein [Cellulomonas fimi ATCC 484]NNH08486.1 DJ-1/PfpI family protein [Cellulomonas fimi]VEH32530.1 transcriptional activator FtrA [Cellulomonas fimi]